MNKLSTDEWNEFVTWSTYLYTLSKDKPSWIRNSNKLLLQYGLPTEDAINYVIITRLVYSMILNIIIGILMIIPAFFMWALIHELSHLIAAKLTCGVNKFKIKLIPHVDKKTKAFCLASISYWPKRKRTDIEIAIISLAPRVMDIIGCVALPFVAATWLWPLIVLIGGCAIDQIGGSIGYSEHSDLRKAADKLKVSPWWLRGIGMSIAVISLISTVFVLIIT